MKKIFTIVLVGWLACCISQDSAHEWPSFQHDPQHTGYSSSQMPSSLTVSWEYEGPRTWLTRAVEVIVSEEKVIAALHPSVLLSLDSNGFIQWKIHESIEGFPTAYKDKIYIGLDNSIACFDKDTGEILWKYEERPLSMYVEFSSPPLVVDTYVIMDLNLPLFIDGPTVPSHVNELARIIVCLDNTTGEKIWEFQAKDSVVMPIYYENRVYTNDGRTYCLDVETGEIIWEKEDEIKGASYLLMSSNGKRIFVVSYKGVVACLSESGEDLWHFYGGDRIITAPAVGQNKIYFGTENGTFYCVDAMKGTLLWKKELKSPLCSPVLADGKVAVGGESTLYILSALSGNIVETYTIGAGVHSLALSNGKLIVGTEYGRIICLESARRDYFAPLFVAVIGLLISIFIALKVRNKSI